MIPVRRNELVKDNTNATLYYFLDTGPLVALIFTRDQYHTEARRIQRALLKEKRIAVTTDYVLTEVYALLIGRGGWHIAKQFTGRFDDLHIKVVYQGESGFIAARDTLLRYPDKTFSLTDCASFNTMRAYGISEAFTFDRHFAQVGFVIAR